MSERVREGVAAALRLARAGRFGQAGRAMAAAAREAALLPLGPVLVAVRNLLRREETAAPAPPSEKGGAAADPHPAEPHPAEPHPAERHPAEPHPVEPRTEEPPDRPAAVLEPGRFVAVAGSRDYLLFTPGRRDTPPPLLLMLHGCRQDAADFLAGTGMNRLAEEHGVMVAYPEQSAAANTYRCWNWFSPADQRRGEGEPSIIAGLARDILRTRGADPARVYVAGLSAGGAAAAVLGQLYPDLFAAVGVHSGVPCGGARDATSAYTAMRDGVAADALVPPVGDVGQPHRPVPTIVVHGDRDTVVNPRNAEAVIVQASAGRPLHRREETVEADSRRPARRIRLSDDGGCTVMEQWIVEGLGHAWSGGDPAGSYTDPSGPDAAAAMLRFFLSHRHPDPSPVL